MSLFFSAAVKPRRIRWPASGALWRPTFAKPGILVNQRPTVLLSDVLVTMYRPIRRQDTQQLQTFAAFGNDVTLRWILIFFERPRWPLHFNNNSTDTCSNWKPIVVGEFDRLLLP